MVSANGSLGQGQQSQQSTSTDPVQASDFTDEPREGRGPMKEAFLFAGILQAAFSCHQWSSAFETITDQVIQDSFPLEAVLLPRDLQHWGMTWCVCVHMHA